jgi:HNH endonuclease
MRRFLHTRTGGVCSARGCGHRHDLQVDHVVPAPAGPTSITNLTPLCSGDHNGKTHGGWVHVLDPESGTLTQTSPLGRSYTTAPTPPVAPTGRRGDLTDLRTRLLVDPDDAYFPTGEPPPDPAVEQETAPPDPAVEVDRWPDIAAAIRDRARTARRHQRTRQAAAARAAAKAAAAEQALIHQLHAELDAATDYQLITAINTEYLTEDNAA